MNIYMNIQTHLYKLICVRRIYPRLVFSVFYSLCGTFIFWFYKTQKKISIPKNILILNTQCCKTEKQTVIRVDSYNKL